MQNKTAQSSVLNEHLKQPIQIKIWCQRGIGCFHCDPELSEEILPVGYYFRDYFVAHTGTYRLFQRTHTSPIRG